MDIEMREQIYRAIEWFRREMPGFSKCYVVDTASGVGIRNGRNMVGVETMTRDEIDSNLPVPEPIALARRSYGKTNHHRKDANLESANLPGAHPIPWKTLISKSFSNVLAAGRCISSEVPVVNSFRLMPICIAIGQAAGITAALSARDGKDAVEVDYAALRKGLLESGAILE